MSFNETMNFEQGYQQLLSEELKDQLPPIPNPSRLLLSNIRMAHSVFQPRGFEDASSSEEHVRVLQKAIKNEPTQELDPILIWWSGEYWRVIDGHHRLLAYRRFIAESGTRDIYIPVREFSGTLNEALFASIAANSKDKLAMNSDDKLNRGWVLTITQPEISKKEVSSICKIGTATVARMRRCLKEIKHEYPECWYSFSLEMTWKDASELGRPARTIDEEWEDKLAREWSKRLAKTFGKKLSSQSAVTARAIEYYSSQLASDLAKAYRYLDNEPEGYF